MSIQMVASAIKRLGSPRMDWERSGFTAVANVLTSMGFALVLGSIYALRNHGVTRHEGLLWGPIGLE